MDPKIFFVDTHCHLNMMIPGKRSDAPLTEQELYLIDDHVKTALEAGIGQIVNVGTSRIESENCLTLAARYPSVFATLGIHPCDADDAPWRADFDSLMSHLADKKNKKIVALGETGLDFYHHPFDPKIQQESFEAHIEAAIAHDLPLVIHVRESASAILNVLRNYVGRARGVIHCFAQSYEFGAQVVDWGFCVGIDAPITYPKNNEFREVVQKLPLDAIIIETDAPFLPPQELRGKQNHPAYITRFAPTLAGLKGVSVEELARVTTRTAQKLFNLPPLI